MKETIMGWKMWKEILHTDPSFWIIYIYIYFCWLAGFGVLFHNNSIFFSAASIKCIVEPSTGENLQSHLAFVAHQMDFRSGYRGSWPPMFQAMQWEWSELWFTVGDCSAINAIVCVKNMWMTHSPAHRHTEMWGSIIGYRIAQPPCKSCPYQQHILHKQIKHWLLFWHCLWEKPRYHHCLETFCSNSCNAFQQAAAEWRIHPPPEQEDAVFDSRS